MTAPNREQFQNTAQTSLNGAINNSVTSITVTDGSVFPASGNFRILIENEILLVTARATNTLTCVRGYESTTAASHSDLTTVTHILTADSLNRFGKDNTPLWGYSSVPALNRVVNDAGDTALIASDFTQTNVSGVTISDEAGTIFIQKPITSGDSVALLTRPSPGGSYSYLASFEMLILPDVGAEGNDVTYLGGLTLRQSTSGKFYTFGIGLRASSTNKPNWMVGKFSSATAADGSLKALTAFSCVAPRIWLKVEDDTTNVNFYMSLDGIHFFKVATQARGTYMTLNGGVTGPDQVGVFAFAKGSSGANDLMMRLVHWSRAS